MTLEVTATNSQNVESQPESWQIGSLKAKNGNSEKVKDHDCLRAVEDAFKWKLSLTKSSQNVHELLWTSQPEEPSFWTMPMVDLQKSLPLKTTFCVKDVAFKELKPKIVGAGKDAVQLQTSNAPRDLTGKHEETVKLLVDATKLPKDSRKVNVGINYQTPGCQPETVYVDLPVQDPNLPDTQPDSKEPQQPTEKPAPEPNQPENTDQGGLGAGFWVILILILMGLGVGAFLYRWNMLIQQNAREVLP